MVRAPPHAEVVWLDDGGARPPPGGQPGRVAREDDGVPLAGPAGPGDRRRAPLAVLALAALLAAAVALPLAGSDALDTGVDLVAPRPDAVLVLDDAPVVPGPEADSRTATRARELAGQARRTWEATLAELPVAPTPQLPSSSRTAAVRDSAWSGRTGMRWTVTTALGEDAQWSLTADVADVPPAPRAFQCRPRTWGLPGGRVLACEVTERAGGVSELRAEAVLSSSPPRAWSSPSQDHGVDADPQSLPGYQRVAEVREGSRRVQVRLLRRMQGDSPPPLDIEQLAAIAADTRWPSG